MSAVFAEMELSDAKFLSAGDSFLAHSEDQYGFLCSRAWRSAHAALAGMRREGGSVAARSVAVDALALIVFVQHSWASNVWADAHAAHHGARGGASLGPEVEARAGALCRSFDFLSRARAALSRACVRAGGADALGVDAAMVVLEELDATCVVRVCACADKMLLTETMERVERVSGSHLPTPPLEAAACVDIEADAIFLTLNVCGTVPMFLRAARCSVGDASFDVAVFALLPANVGPRALPVTLLAARLPPELRAALRTGSTLTAVLLALRCG